MNKLPNPDAEIALLKAQLEVAQMMLEHEVRQRIALEEELEALRRRHTDPFQKD